MVGWDFLAKEPLDFVLSQADAIGKVGYDGSFEQAFDKLVAGQRYPIAMEHFAFDSVDKAGFEAITSNHKIGRTAANVDASDAHFGSGLRIQVCGAGARADSGLMMRSDNGLFGDGALSTDQGKPKFSVAIERLELAPNICQMHSTGLVDGHGHGGLGSLRSVPASRRRRPPPFAPES